jgi:hypothetical protein
MLFSWLDQVMMHGLSRTHGVLHGENKGTLDWLREIPAMSAMDHRIHFDLLEIYHFDCLLGWV